MFRNKTAIEAIAEILKTYPKLSEKEFSEKFLEWLQAQPELYPFGWYDPPPAGTAVLFSQADNFARLQFDTLRKEEFWPKDFQLLPENVGIFYVSPVHKASAVIGDFGTTLYRGNDQKIIDHLDKCFQVLRKVADFIQVGMEFREIHAFAQNLFHEK